MLRIGLTGGIGSGKSTVAMLFAARGVPVLDADEIARQLTEPGQPTYENIVQIFGANILEDNHRVDRNKLRERVFTNAIERGQLEAILHPRIRTELRAKLSKLDSLYCVLAVPLLIESDFIDLVDRILVVDAAENLQIQRTAARSGLTEPEIRKIMSAQASRALRLQKANEVIENNADRKHLESEVERLHQWYRALAATVKKD